MFGWISTEKVAVDRERQRQLAAGGEERARELVIGEREGEQHRREDAGKDQREGDLAEGASRARRRATRRPPRPSASKRLKIGEHDQEGEGEGVDDVRDEGRAPPMPRRCRVVLATSAMPRPTSTPGTIMPSTMR